MARRSSSMSSLHRPPDFSKTAPFVPREVFRLVLRLEAQKALDVNVAAMEQRFHVPPGYADDESLNARGELKQQKNVVPGPGTYEVPVNWPVRDVTATPTAAFLSRTIRGPSSSARRVASASHMSLTRQASIDRGTAAKVLRPHTATPNVECAGRTTKSPRSRLRLPSPADHRDISIQIPDQVLNEPNERSGDESTRVYSSLNPQSTSTFSKLGRGPEIEKESAPAVGSYEVKRLWDSTASRTNMGAPSPALFGASKEKRVVTWRPAITPSSSAASTSWDSSRHYAKQKGKVVRSAARRRLQSAKLHATTISSSQLRPATTDAIMQSESTLTDSVPVETPEHADGDPFSWLRQRPNGEHRVNFLAAKHGLFHHMKSPTRRSSENRRSTISNWDDQGLKLIEQHSNLQDDGDGSAEPVYTAKKNDVRIQVSCRMPGGMLITASVYSLKKLGHFKSAILSRQKRFQSVNEFDLYHVSGRRLTKLDDTLATCGVHDRSLLQIVPAGTIALFPQAGLNKNLPE